MQREPLMRLSQILNAGGRHDDANVLDNIMKCSGPNNNEEQEKYVSKSQDEKQYKEELQKAKEVNVLSPSALTEKDVEWLKDYNPESDIGLYKDPEAEKYLKWRADRQEAHERWRQKRMSKNRHPAWENINKPEFIKIWGTFAPPNLSDDEKLSLLEQHVDKGLTPNDVAAMLWYGGTYSPNSLPDPGGYSEKPDEPEITEDDPTQVRLDPEQYAKMIVEISKDPEKLSDLSNNPGFSEFVDEKLGMSIDKLKQYITKTRERGLVLILDDSGKFGLEKYQAQEESLSTLLGDHYLFPKLFQEMMSKLPKAADQLGNNPSLINRLFDQPGFSEFLQNDIGLSPKYLRKFFNTLQERGLTMSRNNETGKFELDASISAEQKKEILSKLVEISDRLDKIGAVEEANLIDGFIEKHAVMIPKLSKKADDVVEYKKEDQKSDQSKRYDSKYHKSIQVRDKNKKQVDREGKDKHHASTYRPVDGTLSTRYCPLHVGEMLGRVGENTYQCPRDNEIYNWETGYVDVNGNDVPGSSVAGQTPGATGYFETPHRIFDSREDTLNRIN